MKEREEVTEFWYKEKKVIVGKDLGYQNI